MSNFRDGGLFALGVMVGFAIATVLGLVLSGAELLPLKDNALTGAVIGALIAGFIGVGGQLLTVVQAHNAVIQGNLIKERASLETLLSILVRIISNYAQAMAHLESSDPFDNIMFGNLSPLMKPLNINDRIHGIDQPLRVLALSLGDRKMFNALNMLDSNLANFRWADEKYSASCNALLEGVQASGGVGFCNGQMIGTASIKQSDHFMLSDLQDHYREAVYTGLIYARFASDVVLDHLKQRHKVDINFDDRISAEKWQMLRSAVDVGDNFQDE